MILTWFLKSYKMLRFLLLKNNRFFYPSGKKDAVILISRVRMGSGWSLTRSYKPRVPTSKFSKTQQLFSRKGHFYSVPIILYHFIHLCRGTSSDSVVGTYQYYVEDSL